MTVALRLLSALVSAAAATGQSPLAPTPEYATFGGGCAGSQPAPHLTLMPVGSGVRWATAPVTGGVMCVELTGMPSPTGFLITGASRTWRSRRPATSSSSGRTIWTKMA